MGEHTAGSTSGIEIEAVTRWLQTQTEVTPPVHYELCVGGHSNLTFRVNDSQGRQFVLRRPPKNSVLATAHDMEREHRIVSALEPSPVPVPPLVGICRDSAIIGAPFYVMQFVDGIVARNSASAKTIPARYRMRACEALMSTLATLHHIPPSQVGLNELGRHEAYIARQLRRWSRQIAALDGLGFPELHDVHSVLEARIPEQKTAGIVHGDYRLDNCITTPMGQIAAVLDWELCPLGDVRADLGTLLAYWVEPTDTFHPLEDPPTAVEGYATRRQLVELYSEASGLSLDSLEVDYFYAFANWRLACILEGVYARYLANAMGAIPETVHTFPKSARTLVARAADALNGKSILE